MANAHGVRDISKVVYCECDDCVNWGESYPTRKALGHGECQRKSITIDEEKVCADYEEKKLINWQVRFFSDGGAESKKVEALLKKAGVKYLTTFAKVDDVNPPAVEYQGYYFQGISEIRAFFLGGAMGLPIKK